jgi:hypothetical protein
MTDESLQQTNEWLTGLAADGWDTVVREVAAVLSEARNARAQTRRYRTTLWETAVMLEKLFDESGHVHLIDASRDIKRLMQWSETDTAPIQLDLFSMDVTR